MCEISNEKRLFLGFFITMTTLISFIVMLITSIFILDSYCQTITTFCNVTNINDTSIWIPINKKYNLLNSNCPYINDKLKDKEYKIVDCLYDPKYECPSDTCDNYKKDQPAYIILILSPWIFVLFIIEFVIFALCDIRLVKKEKIEFVELQILNNQRIKELNDK